MNDGDTLLPIALDLGLTKAWPRILSKAAPQKFLKSARRFI
jgi:hypothetical protein